MCNVHVNCTYSCLFPCICTECLLRTVSSNYFFPNFMGMLCNKDADVKNVWVFGNVFSHRIKRKRGILEKSHSYPWEESLGSVHTIVLLRETVQYIWPHILVCTCLESVVINGLALQVCVSSHLRLAAVGSTFFSHKCWINYPNIVLLSGVCELVLGLWVIPVVKSIVSFFLFP